MKQKYQALTDQYKKQEKTLRKRSLILGFSKLGTLLFFLLSVWNGIQTGFETRNLLCMAFFGVSSVPLWLHHITVTDEIRKLQTLQLLAQDYLKRMTEAWKSFPDDGAEFVNTKHPYSYDLDIFGKNSLFQLLNVAKTFQGRHQFAADLSDPNDTAHEITARQTAIDELSERHTFLLQLQCLGKEIQNSELLPPLIQKLEDCKLFLKSERVKQAICCLPAVSLPLAVLACISGTTPLLLGAACLFTLQIILWLCFSLKSNRYLSEVAAVQDRLEDYAQMFRLTAHQKFHSKLLCSLQKNMGEHNEGAARAISKLDGLVQCIQARTNILLYILLNALFLWDIQCCLSLETWQKKYSPKVRKWFDHLAAVESLCSFSTLRQVTSNITNPKMISDGNKLLYAKSLGHPLIPAQQRVCNDYEMGKEIIVVSGSNMSGKTTFLRTVGINLLLAKCGCGVCAKEMSFTNLQLITSMRISDSLTEGVSTFYAELKKIKSILTAAQQERNILFLIDEIFRGTNSADRTAGAKQVMKKLSAYGASGLMTTHDLKLCEDFEQVHLHNYHFSEQYSNGALSFDYRIKKGIAQSTNGRYLMRMLGFYDENK